MRRFLLSSGFCFSFISASACNSTETGNPLNPSLPGNEINQSEFQNPDSSDSDIDVPDPDESEMKPDDAKPDESIPGASFGTFRFVFDPSTEPDDGSVGGAPVDGESRFSLNFKLSSLTLKACDTTQTAEEIPLNELTQKDERQLEAVADSICEILLKSAPNAEIQDSESLDLKDLTTPYTWRFPLKTPWSLKTQPGQVSLYPSADFGEEQFDELGNQEQGAVSAAQYTREVSALSNIWSLKVPSSQDLITSEKLSELPFQDLCSLACGAFSGETCENAECQSCEPNQSCSLEQLALLQCQASNPGETLACDEPELSEEKSDPCQALKTELENCDTP